VCPDRLVFDELATNHMLRLRTFGYLRDSFLSLIGCKHRPTRWLVKGKMSLITTAPVEFMIYPNSGLVEWVKTTKSGSFQNREKFAKIKLTDRKHTSVDLPETNKRLINNMLKGKECDLQV